MRKKSDKVVAGIDSKASPGDVMADATQSPDAWVMPDPRDWNQSGVVEESRLANFLLDLSCDPSSDSAVHRPHMVEGAHRRQDRSLHHHYAYFPCYLGD